MNFDLCRPVKEVWSAALQSSTCPVLTPGKYVLFIQKQYIFELYIYILQKFMVNVQLVMSPLEKILFIE